MDPLVNILNETHLIMRMQQGNTEAFTPLVRKYHLKIYRHILRRVKNAETAKDLTRETWIKVFRHQDVPEGGFVLQLALPHR